MSTVKLKLDTACDFLNMNLFGMVYQEDIERTVKFEADSVGKGVQEYLESKFPGAEISSFTAQAYMTRVFLDKLSSLSIVI